MDIYEQNFSFKMRFLRVPRQKKRIFLPCGKRACAYCSALIFRGLLHNNGHNSCFLDYAEYYSFGQNILDKLWFLWGVVPYGENSISIFQEFFASIDKILVLGAGLSARL